MWWWLLACSSSPDPQVLVKATVNAPERRVLLTFDDIPSQTRSAGAPTVIDPALRTHINTAILTALAEAKAPAVGFVNCDNTAEGAPQVRAWHEAGIPLGNHTASHRQANDGTVDDWTADLERCDRLLTEVTGQRPTLFRFPYLRRGAGERREALAGALTAAGYRAVGVTAATSEWYLAERYRALPEQQEAIAEALVAHMRDSLELAQTLAAERLERDDVVHITLMHVNELTAATLPDVLEALTADGWHFVDVETALADPLYAMEDRSRVDASLSWLYRVAPLQVEESNRFGDAEQSLTRRFGQ